MVFLEKKAWIDVVYVLPKHPSIIDLLGNLLVTSE
jgi:hypothetical protein